MRYLTLALLALIPAHAVHAHEFWISPEAYQVAPGAPIIAELRVGEKLKGAGYPYIPKRAERFEILQGGETFAPEATIGDRPALNRALPDDGLAIIVHETADMDLRYRKWEKFVAFTEHKDFTWAQDMHRARGIPDTDFIETYRRYGKALVGIGDSAGADRVTGLDTEIVALANPYTDDLSGGLPVQVLADGAPRVDAQVEVIARAPDETVDVTLYRTDDNGITVITVEPGIEYLVDAVIIEPRDPVEEGDPVWHTLWASLTFRAPDATN